MDSKALQDSPDVGVTVVAPDWTIVEWNEAAARITGLPADRVLGKTFWTAFPTARGAKAEGGSLLGAADVRSLRGRPLADWVPAAQRSPLAAALREGVAKRQRFRLAVDFAGESVREVDAVIENLDPQRATPKLLFLAIDASREVLLQRKVLEADRLSQLGSLLSGVAHELNNPLAAIAAFAEVLKADATEPGQQEAAEVIQTEALRAGRVVQTLLDFARQRPHMRGPIDIKDIVARVIALHRSALKKARVQAVDSITSDVPAVS